MRNLWIFFLRYYAFFIFIFLEVIAFTLIVRNNHYHNATILNSANVVNGNIYEFVSNTTEFFKLKLTNDSLASENAQLRNQLLTQKYDNKTKRIIVNDSTSFQRYSYIEAKVVNNSVTKRNNYLTLNRGTVHGVRKNMGVISNNGIIGIVKDVSSHFCTVISFLHKDSKISAQVSSTGNFGSLVWDGLDPFTATLKDIPTHIKPKIGDKITTTGYSSIFPENILIGTIKNIHRKGGDFFEIDVKLSTDFSQLRYVYIVNDLLAKEKEQLEEGLPK